MKKWIIIIVAIIALIALFVTPYNGLVNDEENVKKTLGDVETAYQRRAELIPNLVKTVQGAGDFEKSTLDAVISARAKATQTTIDPANITPEQLEQFQQAQSGVTSALSRLLVTVEKYPDLKANENFKKLQDVLESTENQILTARTRFNKAVNLYNNKVRTFPSVITAKLFGFNEKPYFKAKEGAENAPEVEFNFAN